MQLRTTSQLELLNAKPADESLFEISQKSGSRFYSKAIPYGVISQSIDSSMAAKYTLNDSDTASARPLSLRQQVLRIDDLVGKTSSGADAPGADMTISGKKTFSSIPAVTAPYSAPVSGQSLVTASVVEGMAKSIVKNEGDFIGADIKISRSASSTAPSNASGNGTQRDEKFKTWMFEDGTYESNVAQFDQTGYLVCYGWLADKGGVAAQGAWVGLAGNVCGGREWALLQVQPWVIGAKSQSLQYIGFNLPYKAGLQLKIVTGFPVDGTSTGFQSTPRLQFAKEGYQPNTFVGYVLYY